MKRESKAKGREREKSEKKGVVKKENKVLQRKE